MKSLDAGQQRERDHLRSQRFSWLNMSVARRWIVATGIAAFVGAAVGAFSFLLDGPWVLFGLGAGALMFLSLLMNVLAPERALSWSVKATTPTAEALKRGENWRNWPG